MDTEFHYWLTGLIARKAGFTENEAEIIAYSSEYVDENDVAFVIEDKITGKNYSNFISQTMNILKPKRELLRIYPIFHFIPGEPDAYFSRRRDGKQHILNTTPNSENANAIMDNAFKSNESTRLFRIGIATHSFVDTWAHQNFVGWYDDFNHIGLDFKPNIGHVDAEHQPDWISHRWIDNRLVESEINNKLRFLSAAKELFKKYTDYLEAQGKPNSFSKWPDLKNKLNKMQGPTFTGAYIKYKENRMEEYKNTAAWLPDFDEHKWFDKAIETEIRGIEDTHDGILSNFTLFRDKYYWKKDLKKEDTDWFWFQEAVKEHERFALKQLSPRFSNMGVSLKEV